MRRAIFYILILFFLGFVKTRAQAPDSLFTRANRLYDQARYAEALDAYNGILSQGYESPELYLNMGNAAYELNKKGQAVYYYEKALRLDPHLKAARDNLTWVQSSLTDRFTPLPRGFFHRIYIAYTRLTGWRVWGWLSLTGIWLAFVFAVAYLLANRPKHKRMFFGLSLAALLLWGLAYAGYVGAKRQWKTVYGIVQPAEVSRYTSPSMASETDGKIHEGTKVRILTRQNDWLQVQTPDGNTFWIPANDVWILK